MIFTLCGSLKFERLFRVWDELLSLSGHAIFSVSVYPSEKGNDKDWYTDEEKTRLDLAHKRKISRSDGIIVLNHWSYIGDSTLSEIEYALEQNKRIYFIESWGKGCGVDSAGIVHKPFVSQYAKRLGFYGKHSPISTVTSSHRDYFSCYELYDLFPGPDRMKYINRLYETERMMYEDVGIDMTGIGIEELM